MPLTFLVPITFPSTELATHSWPRRGDLATALVLAAALPKRIDNTCPHEPQSPPRITPLPLGTRGRWFSDELAFEFSGVYPFYSDMEVRPEAP